MGGPFASNDKDSSFEVWSPPYLNRGRPRISHAQAGLAYGDRFTLGTPQAGEIESVLLIKSPSPQHSPPPDPRSWRSTPRPPAWPPLPGTTTWS